MLEPDIVRLQHMVDAANEALSFVANKSKTELETDRELALALVKSIEIVGEAASKVSRDLRSRSRRFPGLTSLPCAIVLSIAILM
jgi:uncharacterized protein with HEPN domain